MLLAGPVDWPAWFLWLNLGWAVMVLGTTWLGGALRITTRRLAR